MYELTARRLKSKQVQDAPIFETGGDMRIRLGKHSNGMYVAFRWVAGTVQILQGYFATETEARTYFVSKGFVVLV